VYHLKGISSIYNDTGNEIIIFCPFCDDATRRANPTHGHCYIAKTSPVFICFRCDVSGNLRKLLEYTDFKDIKLLNSIASFKSIGTRVKNVYTNTSQIQLDYVNTLCAFRYSYPKEYDIFKNYIAMRIGNVNILTFNILPSFIDNKLICSFYNYLNMRITTRFINNSKIRYKHHGGQYFFQKPKFDNIIICEGPFDIINMYLYGSLKGFFIAMCGKKYVEVVQNLILCECMIGKHNIHVIFDSDVKNKKFILQKLRNIAITLNDEIMINGYVPTLSKDVGEIPIIDDIRY
jgi:hypothetical protein